MSNSTHLVFLQAQRDVINFVKSEWIQKWRINGWKNSNKKPVKNKDLWIKLDKSCKKHKVMWRWVRAHAEDKFNNLVDELAVSKTK